MAPAVSDAFLAFAGGSEMDGRSFQQCVKDAGLRGQGLTITDLDLIFAKHKPKGGRKIDLDAFQQCLIDVAAKRRMEADSVIEKVAATKGPTYSSATTPAGTGCGPERFFYDASTYTGVHKAGGPSVVGSGTGQQGYADLSSLTVRERVQDDALQRRRSMSAVSAARLEAAPDLDAAPEAAAPRTEPRPKSPTAKAQNTVQRPASRAGSLVRSASATTLRSSSQPVVQAATGGLRGPERFFYDQSTYTGVHSRGGASVTDTSRGQDATLAPRPGSQTNPLRGPERFFYDKSTYTGVHLRGGPSIIDKGVSKFFDLSEMTRTGLGPKVGR